MAYNEELPMKAIKQRLKSKTYLWHGLGGSLLAWAVANPATVAQALGFALTGPQAILIGAVGGIVIREFTNKPISDK